MAQIPCPHRPHHPASVAILGGIALAFVPIAHAQPPTTRDIAQHAANRAAFGLPPSQVATLSVSTNAIRTWLGNQLAPTLPNVLTGNGALVLATIPKPPAQSTPSDGNTIPRLLLRQYVVALYTRWQLNEVLTHFWETHFNTSLGKSRFVLDTGSAANYSVWFEYTDNEYLRDNALGNFYQLLRHMAASPAMLAYLDNASNFATAPNENYGRELLELHTLGSIHGTNGTANYTQDDVVNAARVMTGWTIEKVGADWQTKFDDTKHDGAAKTLFQSSNGNVAPLSLAAAMTAQLEGEALLWHLANAEATKDFIVRKLVRLFLGDDALATTSTPPVTAEAALLAEAKAAWGNNGGDIRAVVQVILLSTTNPSFLNGTYRWRKAWNPFARAVSIMRSANVDLAIPLPAPMPTLPGGTAFDANQLLDVATQVGKQGQLLFQHSSPDGYPFDSLEQLGTTTFLDRQRLATRYLPDPLAYPINTNWHIETVITTYVPSAQWGNATVVADFLMHHFYADKPVPAADTAAVANEIANGPFSNPPIQNAMWRWASILAHGFTHAYLQ